MRRALYKGKEEEEEEEDMRVSRIKRGREDTCRLPFREVFDMGFCVRRI